MRDAVQSSLYRADFSRQYVKDIIWRNLPYHADYNSSIFSQLEQCRSDLDRDYFALLDALDYNQQLKVRRLFIQFNETLSRHLHQNRVQLYCFLEKIYKNDAQRTTVIETNKVAMNAAVDTITKTLAKYISPSANYDEKFRRELRAIWTILKQRHYQERTLLYPLYPAMLTPN